MASTTNFEPDKYVAKKFGRCPEKNCSFTFGSATGAERHLKIGVFRYKIFYFNHYFLLDHGFEGRRADAPLGYYCNHEKEDGSICNEHYDNRTARDKHKKRDGHVKKRRKRGDEEDEDEG